MNKFLTILGAAALCLFVLIPPAKAEMSDMEVAVLRGLDKVSARIQTFDLEIGQTVRFGKNLYVRVRACRKSDPIDPPESAAFLEIWQKDMERGESHWVFSGWMFASSPALSAMDHPVYDVWVIDCKNASTADSDDGNATETSGENASSAPEEEADDASVLED